LFAAYDYCEAHDIGAYGGGQFELGVGRDQIQLLAALFHPATPNDVAPGGFNVEPQPGPRVEPARGRAAPDRVRHGRPVIGLAALARERREQLVDRHERQRLDLGAPTRPERDRDTAIVRSSGASTTLTKS
jgi:hypothetical protein